MTLGEIYQKIGDDGWRFVCDADLAKQSLAKHAWRRAIVLTPNGVVWQSWWCAFDLEE